MVDGRLVGWWVGRRINLDAIPVPAKCKAKLPAGHTHSKPQSLGIKRTTATESITAVTELHSASLRRVGR